VGVDTPHERHVQEPRQLKVAHVAPAAGEKARVLPPAHGRTDRHGTGSWSLALIANSLRA
jgi:hypothetical protein